MHRWGRVPSPQSEGPTLVYAGRGDWAGGKIERERREYSLKRERQRRLLRSWAKAKKDSEETRRATRSEGDDLEESAARAREKSRAPRNSE